MPYKIIVEASQLDIYAANFGKDKRLVLPPEYLIDYDTCDDLGDSRSKGPGAARNYELGTTRLDWVRIGTG